MLWRVGWIAKYDVLQESEKVNISWDKWVCLLLNRWFRMVRKWIWVGTCSKSSDFGGGDAEADMSPKQPSRWFASYLWKLISSPASCTTGLRERSARSVFNHIYSGPSMFGSSISQSDLRVKVLFERMLPPQWWCLLPWSFLVCSLDRCKMRCSFLIGKVTTTAHVLLVPLCSFC